MSTPSKFFATFSLRELVNNREPGLSSSGHVGSGCGIGGSARGIAGGSAGGVVGGSARYPGSGEAHCHKSESLSVPVSLSADNRFDEREFIEFLKADLEKRIIDKAAVITQRGDVEGSFHSSEFYVEYSQGKLRGRIVLSGSLSGSTYRLRANIDEKSEEGGFNIDERSDGGFSLADAFRMMKPEGDYYVVAFAHDDPLAEDNKLHYIGQELIRSSFERIRRSMSQEQLRDLKSAEVWCLNKWPPHIERLLVERDLERTFEVPEEYQAYARVFFLNDVALRMYSEGGIRLEALKKVSSDEMPQGCIRRTLRGLYIPNED